MSYRGPDSSFSLLPRPVDCGNIGEHMHLEYSKTFDKVFLFIWDSQVVQWQRFNPWVGKIPWRRKWQPTPIFLAGESPWTEEPGRLQSMGLQRVGHN